MHQHHHQLLRPHSQWGCAPQRRGGLTAATRGGGEGKREGGMQQGLVQPPRRTRIGRGGRKAGAARTPTHEDKGAANARTTHTHTHTNKKTLSKSSSSHRRRGVVRVAGDRSGMGQARGRRTRATLGQDAEQRVVRGVAETDRAAGGRGGGLEFMRARGPWIGVVK